jgi:C1A family cysteine protease
MASESDMIEYVQSTGPLAICVDASEWNTYTKGVVTSCGDDLDHCVQIAGYNAESNYWIVRNQWGSNWGYDGYIYISAGSNTCGIAEQAIYTKVKSA